MEHKAMRIGRSCNAICWLVAVLFGLFVLAAMMTWTGWSWIVALVLGLIAALGAGWVLTSYFCENSDGHLQEGAKPASADTALDKTAEAEAATAEAEKEAKATAAAQTEDNDGDGVFEGDDEGVKPATLNAARDGKPDDLKKIKGIGPKMEIMCNELGFYHFDQIAAWTDAEVAWVDANLKGFKGRVTRDDWVGQAKLLAAGKDTEFSRRVDKGGVY
jgi:predicted flap endonuclease-1-like 5' DNA nuclease